MTTAQSPASATDRLQPVHFRLASNDGTAAVFVAQIKDLKVVSKPVYQLTVTVASSVLSEAPSDLAKFLSRMRAGFALLHKPEPFDDEEDDAGEFDIAAQIRIAPDLIRFVGPGPVDVEVVVETAIGLNALPSSLNELLASLPSYQDAVDKKDHHWDSRSGSKARAIVTPSYGHGRVDPGGYDVTGTKDADLRAKRVTVHGYVYTPYTFTGRFRKEKN
jgi:hypothetical protein